MKTACRSIFVAGTDTGAGKTLVTGMLARMWAENGIKTVTQKWVQTGCKTESAEDIYTHMELMKTDKDLDPENRRVPYRFKFPASPHLAAHIENKTVETNLIKESFFSLQKQFEMILIEGTGGVMVPLNEDKLIIDVVKELNLPVLVVAENRLGAINQTLLTIEVLKTRNIRIVGTIFNQVSEKENEIILKDNMQIVEKMSGIKVLGKLDYYKDKDMLYEKFKPMGEKLVSQFFG
ncbi:MAG: dethiobiotin synthase [Candidatus Omnitrophota bacterium]